MIQPFHLQLPFVFVPQFCPLSNDPVFCSSLSRLIAERGKRPVAQGVVEQRNKPDRLEEKIMKKDEEARVSHLKLTLLHTTVQRT